MTAKIRAAHTTSKGTYGAPCIQADLVAEGIQAGLKRIARLMRAAGLSGVSRRKGAGTTIRDDGTAQAPDLVDRNFVAQRPNQLWVADITYIPTWAGFLYPAVVLDAFSRRIVGWSMALTLHTQLGDALNMALMMRRPEGVIHHSDHGSQYTSTGSANGAGRRACGPRWARSAMPMTVRELLCDPGVPAVLGRRCARQLHMRAGRDEKMISAEPKDRMKGLDIEDTISSKSMT